MRRVVPSPRGEQSPKEEISYVARVLLMFIKRNYEDFISFEVNDHLNIWCVGPDCSFLLFILKKLRIHILNWNIIIHYGSMSKLERNKFWLMP